MQDRVDRLLDQWSRERPELDCTGLGVVARVQMLAKRLERAAETALNPLGLKMWEYDVLSALRRQGHRYLMPATQLAKEAMLSSGAMTNRIDRLECRGLVVREPDPSDRRGVLVVLTESGKKLIDDAIHARLGVADCQLSMLDSNERVAISDGLRKVMGDN
ncbi:MAG: MarR family transcriptional regulator [Gammaproteobacteria bacterium]|nr:MarR family transcriptional regulator [Gammaproteobacteria bacterium]